jgi:hypothetical protein
VLIALRRAVGCPEFGLWSLTLDWTRERIRRNRHDHPNQLNTETERRSRQELVFRQGKKLGGSKEVPPEKPSAFDFLNFIGRQEEPRYGRPP